MQNNNYYQKEEEIRKLMDKVADGERLTKSERERVDAYRPHNYCYNPNTGCMGRRYKDL